MQKINSVKFQFISVVISILFTLYLLGLDYIKPNNIDWLYLGDLSQYQLGWEFFRDDKWRFPLGANPNYGLYLNASIVFSDSIPIFAIFFKLIKFILPENFQYFSIWIMLCIYLQIFFSFKIIFKYTNNFSFSFISTFFFIFATIFIHRNGIHLSLMGQWIILFYLYYELEKDKNYFQKILPILLSVLIHFYFTVILFFIFFLNKIFSLIKKKITIKALFLELVILFSFVLLLMYLSGYFVIKIDDGLGWGYGYYNFNLNSFFNPSGANYAGNFGWSKFLPELSLQNKEQEGFAYLGIVGILFLFLYIFNLFYKKYDFFLNGNEFLIISIILIIIATSNNINFGDNNLYYVALNKYIYLIFSSIRASGRLIWPVYYLIFIFGILYIFKIFYKKNPSLILLFLLIIQLIDISPGLLNYKFGTQYKSNSNKESLDKNIWKNLSRNFEIIRLAQPGNHTLIYSKLSKYILSENFKKTDVIYLARVNRELITSKKYELVNKFNNKNKEIFDNTIFVTEDLNLIRNIYFRYKNQLYYYFVDDIWLVASSPIIKNLDTKKYPNMELFVPFEMDSSYVFNDNLKDKFNSLLGFGWKVSENSDELILDGYFSSLYFNLKKNDCSKNQKIKFRYKNFYEKKNFSFIIQSITDDNLIKKVALNTNDSKEIYFDLNCGVNEINFLVEEPLSLFDIRQGLNRQKRSIVLNSIEFLE